MKKKTKIKGKSSNNKPEVKKGKKRSASAISGRFKKRRSLSGGQHEYRAWKEWEEGDTLVGKYVGKSSNNFGGTNRHFEVLECSWDEELVGKVIVLNPAGNLNKLFKGESPVKVGAVLQIEYGGLVKLKKGKMKGKEAHDLIIDEMLAEGEEDTDDNDEDDESFEDESSDDEDEDDSDDEDDEDEEDEDEEEDSDDEDEDDSDDEDDEEDEDEEDEDEDDSDDEEEEEPAPKKKSKKK